MPQVDQITVAAAEKPFAGEGVFQLFHLTQALPCFAARQVVDKVMIEHFHIPKILQGNAADAVSAADAQPLFAAQFRLLLHFIHEHGEGKVLHGLEHVADGARLVALDGVLRHAGDEDERHLGVALAQLEGAVHAVHVRHFDIHEHGVVTGLIVADKIKPRREDFGRDLFAPLGGVALQKAAQHLRVGGLVFYDGDVEHVLSSLFCRTRELLFAQQKATGIPVGRAEALSPEGFGPAVILLCGKDKTRIFSL